MSISNAFQKFNYSMEQISGVKGKFFNRGGPREYLYADGNSAKKVKLVIQKRVEAKEGAELWRKRQVSIDRREGRDEYTCLVNPCKAIVRICYL